jgi:competence protein CoiA
MQFAFVDGNRRPAEPGLSGECPACRAEVIAKCGKVRVPHWAHRATRHCDPWWEPETEWHRAWKSEFPEEYQEQPVRSSDGELHIADVRHPHTGLVIEFQHSAISEEEVASREAFWQPMLWIVDGLRLKRTREKFYNGLTLDKRISALTIPFSDAIPAVWRNRKAPVLLDFGPGSNLPLVGHDNSSHRLWCIYSDFPNHRVVLPIGRAEFLVAARDGLIEPDTSEVRARLVAFARLRANGGLNPGRRARF